MENYSTLGLRSRCVRIFTLAPVKLPACVRLPSAAEGYISTHFLPLRLLALNS